MGIVAAAGIGAAGSIFSGLMGAQGAGQSAKASIRAAQIASDTALELDNRARRDVAPFRRMGLNAGNTLQSILSGEADLDMLTKPSSLFKWESELGSRNINRELSARGLHGSGAGLETLARFNTQLVAEEGQRYWDRLWNMTQLGANVTSQQATNTSATGRAAGGMLLEGGIAAGRAYADQGRAYGSIGTGVSDAVQGGMQNYMMSQRLYGGGGGSFAPTGNYGNGLTGFNAGGGGFLVNTPGYSTFK